MNKNEFLKDKNEFIQKSFDEIIYRYGGNSNNWIQTRMYIDREINGHPEFKLYFIKVDDVELEVVESILYYPENRKTMIMKKVVYPFKNITTLTITHSGAIIYDDFENRIQFDLDMSNYVEKIVEKYNTFYEVEHNKNQFSIANEIKKFKKLLDDEVITEDEFSTIKRKLINGD